MRTSILQAASILQVNPVWLEKLIFFESSNNPLARNKISGARGLIQFLPSTAKGMGFSSADELVNQYPDFDSQLLNPVLRYLSKYRPFPTEQSLYMAVFYPAFRKVPVDTFFPEKVQKDNPGIQTVRDYISRVNPNYILPLVCIAALVYFFIDKKFI